MGGGLDKVLDRNFWRKEQGARRACLAVQATGSLDRIRRGLGLMSKLAVSNCKIFVKLPKTLSRFWGGYFSRPSCSPLQQLPVKALRGKVPTGQRLKEKLFLYLQHF